MLLLLQLLLLLLFVLFVVFVSLLLIVSSFISFSLFTSFYLFILFIYFLFLWIVSAPFCKGRKLLDIGLCRPSTCNLSKMETALKGKNLRLLRANYIL